MAQSQSWFDQLAQLAPHIGVGLAIHRVLLVGPPGTGKSSAASVVAQVGDRAVTRVACHPAMTPDDLVGGWRLEALPGGGTRTVWTDGPGVRAMVNGSILLLDEIDRAPDEVSPALHALMDDPAIARLRRGDGTEVQPAPGFAVIATANGRPDDLPDAVRDRVEVCLRATVPAPGALARVPEALRGLVRASYDAQGGIAWEWRPSLTMRRAMALVAIADAIGDESIAASLALADSAAPVIASLTAARAAELGAATAPKGGI